MSRVTIASEVDEEVWVELMRHARELGRPLPDVVTEALADYLTQRRFRPDILGSLEATATAGHMMEELMRHAPAIEHDPSEPPPPRHRREVTLMAPRQSPPPPPLQSSVEPAVGPTNDQPTREESRAEQEELVPSRASDDRRTFDPLRIT